MGESGSVSARDVGSGSGSARDAESAGLSLECSKRVIARWRWCDRRSHLCVGCVIWSGWWTDEDADFLRVLVRLLGCFDDDTAEWLRSAVHLSVGGLRDKNAESLRVSYRGTGSGRDGDVFAFACNGLPTFVSAVSAPRAKGEPRTLTRRLRRYGDCRLALLPARDCWKSKNVRKITCADEQDVLMQHSEKIICWLQRLVVSRRPQRNE
ncbi:hypothetical protein Zmor_000167 [Zophobas morio]|uniref:Uncharacterized protein n=1 Tax=Zophobas morio TaxID=2755281 RepID=A0AA38MRH6_9CUCU|nr:hypothetical protein Zmor_000167 [Zophobas morio]